MPKNVNSYVDILRQKQRFINLSAVEGGEVLVIIKEI